MPGRKCMARRFGIVILESNSARGGLNISRHFALSS